MDIFIFSEVMVGGNFGRHDERIKRVGRGKTYFFYITIQHNWYLALIIRVSFSGLQIVWCIIFSGSN